MFQVDSNIKLLGEADKAKRHKLSKLVEDVQNVFPSDEDIARLEMVEGLLSQDGTSNDIRKDSEERIRMLQENECCILVSGYKIFMNHATRKRAFGILIELRFYGPVNPLGPCRAGQFT